MVATAAFPPPACSRQDVFERGIATAPGGRRKPGPASSGQHRRMSLVDLSRRQTAQPADLAATLDLARASLAGEQGEAGSHGHARQSVLGEAVGHSRRPFVFGEAALAAAHHRLSALGGQRASMLGGPRMSMLGHDARSSHAGGHRASVLGGLEHPAPVAEEEQQVEEAPVELTPEQVGGLGLGSGALRCRGGG